MIRHHESCPEAFLRVCFVSTVVYTRPLDPTSKRKFRALSADNDLFVVGFSESLVPRCFREHARFYLLPLTPFSPLRYLVFLIASPPLLLWLTLRHRLSILVAQSPYEAVSGAWVKMLARPFGCRLALVVESHGDFEQAVFLQRRVSSRRLYRWLMDGLARFSLRRADALRAISNATAEQLKGIAPDLPLVRFPGWTNIEDFLSAGEGRSDGNGQQIVFVGSLTPLKGVHHLVAAFREIAPAFPDARLVIVGREDNRTYARELKSGAGERVSFRDVVPQLELAAIMASSCVLVLPSLSEGFGRVLLEAMATGTPVIGTRVGGIPDVIEDGVTGILVPTSDEVELARSLRWLLSHPGKARAMGERGRAFASGLFSTEAYVAAYRRLFEAAGATSSSDPAPKKIRVG